MWTSRFQIAEECFAMRERRAFVSRARSDRAVGLWAASKLGLCDAAARTYAEAIVAAGVDSTDGRGGFDRIAADLARLTIGADAIRTRYLAETEEAARPSIATASALHV